MSSSCMKWVLAVPLAALFATACTNDVTQEESGTAVRALFDSTRSLIPTPSDLALQSAPSVVTTTTRAALFSAIGAGGFPGGSPNALNVINIPYELVVDGVGTTATSATPSIDPNTITTSTVAILRVTGAGAPARIDPSVIGTTNGSLRLFPATGYTSATRYVVAVRGGPNGIKTEDGRSLSASSAIFLITNNVNLSDPDARPASLGSSDAARLAAVKTTMTAPLDWDPVNDVSTCRTQLGMPPTAPLPEGVCWLPVQIAVGAVTPAFNAVNAIFPVNEAISIQTFEIAGDSVP